MVPQKVWESKNAQRLNFYEKIEFSKPSELLQKQVLLETIDEVNQRIPGLKQTMYFAWTL